MQITAAVVREKSAPFTLEQLDLDEPGPTEVLIRLVATGLCHTDLVARDQMVPVPLPAVLGHEGAGVVERVGAAVTKVAAGDHVVLSFASCGHCASCLAAHPAYCERFQELNFGGKRADGSVTLCEHGKPVSGSFFGQSSFATYALASERNVVKVGKDAPLELLGPLGCGIQTGAGAVLNVLRPEPASSIAVFGTGAVGLSAIMAAKIARCGTIVAVDVVPSRLDLARELGATHVVNGKDEDAVKAIVALGGVEYSAECTGNAKVARQAVDCLRQRGICALVGVAAMGATVDLDINTMLLGHTVVGTTEGDAVPDLFIPRLVQLHAAGALPLEKIIKVYEFADINQAVEDSESGRTVKAVLRIGRV